MYRLKYIMRAFSLTADIDVAKDDAHRAVTLHAKTKCRSSLGMTGLTWFFYLSFSFFFAFYSICCCEQSIS